MSERVLDAWRDGLARAAIIDFVARVTEEGAGFVPPEERVAVFDNDGTLWCEKPMPIQLDFLIRLLAARARQDPTLAGRSHGRRPSTVISAGSVGRWWRTTAGTRRP